MVELSVYGLGLNICQVAMCDEGLVAVVNREVTIITGCDGISAACSSGDHWAAWVHLVKDDVWQLVYDGQIITDLYGPAQIIAIPRGGNFATTWRAPLRDNKLDVVVFGQQELQHFATSYASVALSIQPTQPVGVRLLATDCYHFNHYLAGIITTAGEVLKMEEWPLRP